MATAIPTPSLEVLEDGDGPLLPEAKVEDGDEVVDLLGEPEDVPAGEVKPVKKVVAPAAQDEEADVPTELKGKSKADIAKMYRDAQSLIGRQGSELGELRRRTDNAIQTTLAALAKRDSAGAPAAAAAAADAAPKPIDEADFFRAPQEAIARAIESSPVIKSIRETLGKSAQDAAISRAAEATAKFNTAHPDAGTILQDSEFRNWVAASPIRTDLLKRAHHNFDFAAGDEVFSTWKALKGAGVAQAAADQGAAAAVDQGAAAASAAATALAKRKRDLAAAAVPNGGNASPGKGGAKRIFRRADVLKLMEEDNDRYQALAPEIELAYKEGRVR
jgi:hypothetical protein